MQHNDKPKYDFKEKLFEIKMYNKASPL